MQFLFTILGGKYQRFFGIFKLQKINIHETDSLNCLKKKLSIFVPKKFKKHGSIIKENHLSFLFTKRQPIEYC